MSWWQNKWQRQNWSWGGGWGWWGLEALDILAWSILHAVSISTLAELSINKLLWQCRERLKHNVFPRYEGLQDVHRFRLARLLWIGWSNWKKWEHKNFDHAWPLNLIDVFELPATTYRYEDACLQLKLQLTGSSCIFGLSSAEERSEAQGSAVEVM